MVGAENGSVGGQYAFEEIIVAVVTGIVGLGMSVNSAMATVIAKSFERFIILRRKTGTLPSVRIGKLSLKLKIQIFFVAGLH